MRKRMFGAILAVIYILMFTGAKPMLTSTENTYDELLKKAMAPVGFTMYIWGGGWNEEDTGAGVEAVTIGVSPQWSDFAMQCNTFYDYKKTKYQIHNGLDCSGYIGWLIYNVFHDQSGEKGYVMSSTKMAKAFADYGWGNYTPADKVTSWKAGDIMSMEGHVWMSLGMCKDGSVVLVHSSPPGVRLSGTLLKDGRKSEAVKLAEQYMSQYFPMWYSKYPACGVSHNYLKKASQFRWNAETLVDEYGYLNMSANEVLMTLFSLPSEIKDNNMK